MVYSATVSQLINSIESHSITFRAVVDDSVDSDSIRTKSISHSSSQSATSSCKSISEPSVLFSKVVLDLKRAARESESKLKIDGLTEYWDTWNYWKKHPFVIRNNLLTGQLILEHLLILTNLKYESKQEIFEDLKLWLHKISQEEQGEGQGEEQREVQGNLQYLQANSKGHSQGNSHSYVQLRDQICAGFFLIFCSNPKISLDYLHEIKNSLASEYFEALKTELLKRDQDHVREINSIPKLGMDGKLNFLFCFLKEIAINLLEKMKTRHRLIVAAIKSNAKNFLLFCKNLLKIILRKLKIIK